MIVDPYFYAVAAVAVILMGLSKGGFIGLASLSLPLLALVTTPVRAAALTLPILVVQDIVSVWAYRHHWDRRTVGALLPGALLGIFLGWALAAWVSSAAILLIVGIISVVYAVRRLAQSYRRIEPAPAGHRPIQGTFWGAVCGFTSMIAHAGQPPFQIYVLPLNLPPMRFAATGAVFFAIVNLVKVGPYIALGQLTPDNLLTSATLIPLAILSTWVGVILVKRIDAAKFFTAIYLLLLLVGAKLVYDGWQQLS